MEGHTSSVDRSGNWVDDSVDARAALQLAMLPGVGPRTLASLLETFGTAKVCSRPAAESWPPPRVLAPS